ncbi:MAG: helix-turn-helix transcriptional regulator [Kofleriaceae bacterium]
MRRKAARSRGGADIPLVGYHPPRGYDLDLEVFPLAAVKERASVASMRVPRRLEFHLLVYLQRACTHVVDFETVRCAAGTMLALRPGQVHHFASSATAEGWLVAFQPQFLWPATAAGDPAERLAELDVLLQLRGGERDAVEEAFARMLADAAPSTGTVEARHALLRYQLLVVLERLVLVRDRREAAQRLAPGVLQRFKRFRDAVEREFRVRHKVSQYTRLVGCTEKSLNRATQDAAGVSAKTYLSRRLVLEARRLLVHTELQVAEIADALGFAEATNFVKFFRRETGVAPGAFRRQQAALPR